MGFKSHVTVREDVVREDLDEKLAPELHEIVLGTAPPVYSDPGEFFERTYLTSSIKDILMEIASTLKSGGGLRVIPILSFFGGGKTHTLISIYHAVNSPSKLTVLDKELASMYRGLGSVKIIVVSGKADELAPSPLAPMKTERGDEIRTLWGYLAYQLGKYDEMKSYDEKLLVPGEDKIRKMLAGTRVVILIDEIGEYFKRLVTAGGGSDAGLRYAEAVVSFLGYLASAVASTDNVLVITLPAELKTTSSGEEIKVEEAYSIVEELLRRLLTYLKRIGGRVFTPVREKTELYGVLRKRLFKNIDVENAIKELESTLFKAYREYRENVFGDTSRIEKEIPYSYPFHPEYLDVLELIAEKVTGQRTRMAVRVSRIILRNFYESDCDPALIMPWHIDPGEHGLEGLLFTGMHSVYRRIYKSDVRVLREAGGSRGELAYITALTVFLETYPYDSLVCHQVFPDATEIAKAVYEPVFFEDNKYRPTDVLDVLSDLVGSNFSKHLYYDPSRGRYWYSRIPNIKEWIDSEANKLLRNQPSEIENRIFDYAKKLMTYRYQSREEMRKVDIRPFTRAGVFDEKYMFAGRVVEAVEDLVRDDGAYKLVAVLYDDPDKIRELILKHRGAERTFLNTVVAVSVSDAGKRNQLMREAANMIAAENVSKQIDQVYSEYYREAGNYYGEVKRLQKNMAEYYKSIMESSLIMDIVAFFDKIYYPSAKNGKSVVETTYASSSDTSISERVVTALKHTSVGKIVDKMTFNDLREYLRRIGILIEPGKNLTVSQIVSAFKIRPELPMVRENVVKNALKEGVEKLEVALKDEFGKLYFKDVYEEEEISGFMGVDKGRPSTEIRDSMTIIHWRDAVKELVDRLKKEVREFNEKEAKRAEETGERRILEYYVVYDGTRYPIQDIENVSGWEEIVRKGVLVKSLREERIGVTVSVEPKNIELTSTSRAEVRITVESVGGYRGRVKLELPECMQPLREASGIPDFTITCIINGSRVNETRAYEIRAVDEAGRLLSSTFLTVKVKSEVVETRDPGDLKEGDKLLSVEGELRNHSLLDALARLEDALGEDNVEISELNIVVSGEYGKAQLRFETTRPSIVQYMISELSGVLGNARINSGEFKLVVKNETELTMSLISILRSILSHEGVKAYVKRAQ